MFLRLAVSCFSVATLFSLFFAMALSL